MSTVPIRRASERLIIFDIIRSIAIFLVVIAHIGFYKIGSFYPGSIGVSLFLILSGMNLEHSYQKRCPTFKEFIQKRMVRIYPTYFMTLILAMFILGSSKLPTDIPETLLSLSGFCAFAGKWGCSLVETSWFIGLIMSLYVTYPFLSRWISHTPYSAVTALFIISTISNFFVPDYLPGGPLSWFPLCRIFEFGLGIFLVHQKTIVASIEDYRLPCGAPLFQYISDISLPVFLIHYPLISVVPFWRTLGGPWFGLAVYFALTWTLSHLTLLADRAFQMHLKSFRSQMSLAKA